MNLTRGDTLFGPLLSILIIVLSLTMFVLDVKYYRSTAEPWRWIKLMYAVLGVYWAGIYTLLLIDEISPTFIGPPLYAFARTFIRPGVLLTISAMLAGAIIRGKHAK